MCIHKAVIDKAVIVNMSDLARLLDFKRRRWLPLSFVDLSAKVVPADKPVDQSLLERVALASVKMMVMLCGGASPVA